MRNTEDYFNSKLFKSILKEYEDNEKNGIPTIISSDDYTDIAEYYYNNGKIDEVMNVIDTTLKLYPGATSPLLFKSRIELLDNENIAKAEEYAEQIEDKNDLEYFYLKAEIMLVQGQTKAANEYLKKQYKNIVAEDDKEYYKIDVATLFVDYDELEIAESWRKHCKKKNLIEYKELEAKLTLNRGEFDKSKKLYQELIDSDPYSTNYWNSLASSQFMTNEIEASIDSSEYSIAIDPNNALAFLTKANGLYNLGNFSEALIYYKRYNELCQDDENGEMLIGLCYLMQEDFENAIKHLSNAEKLCEYDSQNILDIYKDLAYALCRLNRVDEAMAVLDKAKNTKCDSSDILVYKGSLLLGCGDFDKARLYFIDALKDSNYNTNVLLKIAISVYELGDLNLSYKIFNLLYSNNNDFKNGYAFYAACCYDLGEYAEFIKYLEYAVRNSPEETRDVLGSLFPEGMPPNEYCEYIKKKLNM